MCSNLRLEELSIPAEMLRTKFLDVGTKEKIFFRDFLGIGYDSSI